MQSCTDRTSLAIKVAYGVGALSDSIKTSGFSLFLLFYYTTVLGLPGTLLGFAMSVGLVWDAAIDPLIGHLSDHATFKFGRRHSFMLVGAVAAAASFMAVFNPPAGLSTAALFAWLMVSSLCLRSSNSLFMVPYYALGAELAADYHDRTSIAGFRSGAVLAGTMLATTAAFLVFLPTDSGEALDPKFAPSSYASMGVAFGAVMMAVALVATLGTLGERWRLGGNSSPHSDGGLSLPRAMGLSLRAESFRVLVLSSALSSMAMTVNAVLALYFLTYHVRLASSQLSTLYFVTFYAGSLIGVVVWVRVARHVQKQYVYAVATMMAGAVMSAGYWLIGQGRPFGLGATWVLFAGSGLVGLFNSAAVVIAPSMMADISAREELRTGRRHHGIHFGIYSFGQQISNGLAVLAAGVLADRFARLVPGQAAQAPSTIERLVVLSNVAPAVLLFAAGLIILRYRVTRQDVQANQREPVMDLGREQVPELEGSV
jgi:GPH family glycoside/pentoside/hexuronide:cation symporter